jgi:hypothetical protein
LEIKDMGMQILRVLLFSTIQAVLFSAVAVEDGHIRNEMAMAPTNALFSLFNMTLLSAYLKQLYCNIFYDLEVG